MPPPSPLSNANDSLPDLLEFSHILGVLVSPLSPHSVISMNACSSSTTYPTVMDTIREEPEQVAHSAAACVCRVPTSHKPSPMLKRVLFPEIPFTGRALIEKGWDCHEYLPTIISRIGDHEASVIDTVLCAVENAR